MTMTTTRVLLVLIRAGAGGGRAPAPAPPPAATPAADLLMSGTWIDLSHDYSSETIYWPTAKRFELQVESAGRTPAG